MKHIHRYKRKNLSRDKDKPYIIFACDKVGCTHYLIPSLLEGKLAECPRCDNTFILEKHHLKLAIPHCDGCIVRKENAIYSGIADNS